MKPSPIHKEDMLMKHIISLILFATSCLTLTACVEPESVSPDEDGESISLSQPIELCDGSNEIRLSYSVQGTGLTSPGDRLLSQHGHAFLYIKGTCEYRVYTKSTGAGHAAIHKGTLTQEEARALIDGLEVERWSTLQATHPTGSHPNAGGLSLDGERYPCFQACEQSNQLDSSIKTHLRESLDMLHEAGDVLEGPVKILVVDESSRLAHNTFLETASWPLSTSTPQDYMVSQEDAEADLEQSIHDMGDDAQVAALRNLRTLSRNEQYSTYIDFIPVLSADGTQLFALYVSDVLDWEVESL